MKFRNYDELVRMVEGKANRVVVPGANNDEVLEACKMSVDHRLISGGILIGPSAQVQAMAGKVGLPLKNFEIVDITETVAMCNEAVDLIKEGQGDFLVKGLVDTKFYMKAILRKEVGAVEEGTVLSHFVLFESANYNKLFALTDSAIMINPTLEQKAKIVRNSVNLMRLMGVETPKVSVVCPVEKPNSQIQSTLDAVELSNMSRDGRIKNAVVEGPYDVYITFSRKLADEKGVKGGEVPGQADIVLLADLDAANAMYKTLSFFGAGVKLGALIAGTNIPMLLPSRTDSPLTKLHSIALACFMKDARVPA